MSLFLQDGIQKSDGTIALSSAGSLPPDVELPGKITYFDHSGRSIGVDSFAFPGVEDIDPNPGRRPTPTPQPPTLALPLAHNVAPPLAGRCPTATAPVPLTQPHPQAEPRTLTTLTILTTLTTLTTHHPHRWQLATR